MRPRKDHWNLKRLQFERFVLNGHERWMLLGKLAAGLCQRTDGLALTKMYDASLFFFVDEKHKAHYVHPRWFGTLKGRIV